MFKRLFQNVSQVIRTHRYEIHSSVCRLKTFEPEYLDAYGYLPPKSPEKINIQMIGYNFEILESYQKYVHNLVDSLGIEVIDSWGTPCVSLSVNTFQEGGTRLKDNFKLNQFERNVQITNVSSTDMPIVIDLLRRTLPEGVELSVHQHKEEHYEARFINDPFIDGIKNELKGYEERRIKEIEEKEAKEALKKK